MFTNEKELNEMFDLSGPPLQELVEGVDYIITNRHKCSNIEDLLDYIYSDKNVGNRFAKGPPKGNTNNIKKYWYKTPFEEGIACGKKELQELGFPGSIVARRHDHYVGGTGPRNHKWKGWEFKTLT